MNRLMRIALKLKALMSVFAIYISLAGAVGFACFILEEAFQTTVFATWQAKDAGDWKLVKKGAGIMDSINAHLKIVNYGIGWINPLSFLSYYDYSRSGDYYIESLEANIFANDPSVFEGEKVTFRFRPNEIEKTSKGIALKAKGITILTDKWPDEGLLVVTGKVAIQEGRVVIVDTQIQKAR